MMRRSWSGLTFMGRLLMKVTSAGQQIELTPQFETQLRVALTPRLEAPRKGVEQPGVVWRRLVKGGPTEETGSQLGGPADVVPRTHLVLEKSRQEQTLRRRGFHHQLSCRSVVSATRMVASRWRHHDGARHDSSSLQPLAANARARERKDFGRLAERHSHSSSGGLDEGLKRRARKIPRKGYRSSGKRDD